MAHLHTCLCGRTFRCEGWDHNKRSWYWCDLKCPDYKVHGASIFRELDAEFLRMCEEAIKGTKHENT